MIDALTDTRTIANVERLQEIVSGKVKGEKRLK